MDFVSLPPSPQFGQLVQLFLNANVPKIWASPNWPNIRFVKSGQKIWAGPSPPLHWTKSKRTATFFGKPSLTLAPLQFCIDHLYFQHLENREMKCTYELQFVLLWSWLHSLRLKFSVGGRSADLSGEHVDKGERGGSKPPLHLVWSSKKRKERMALDGLWLHMTIV